MYDINPREVPIVVNEIAPQGQPNTHGMAGIEKPRQNHRITLRIIKVSSYQIIKT